MVEPPCFGLLPKAPVSRVLYDGRTQVLRYVQRRHDSFAPSKLEWSGKVSDPNTRLFCVKKFLLRMDRDSGWAAALK